VRLALPASSWVTLNLLRGSYLIGRFNPHPMTFTDLRAGFWYAFTR
jgi:hypothetical protein